LRFDSELFYHAFLSDWQSASARLSGPLGQGVGRH